jgi:18S rRNA (adenine1779-N6/adenine1780-N6)-dimethyltransferase
MGKASKRSGGGHGGDKPYSRGPSAAAKEAASKAVNKVFKMNTDLGQHILKNPGVAQALVDKAGLKQSDVCPSLPTRAAAGDQWTDAHR